MNYHNKKFRLISNSENGEVSDDMVFHYQQNGNILTCTYQGENIIKGHLIGLVDTKGNIEMRYHQINKNNELKTGVCQSTPTILKNGKIRLFENWQWTSGNNSKESSILEEI